MLKRFLRSLASDQRGLTTVEYVIVLCVIASLSVGVWKGLGTNVRSYVEHATTTIDDELGE